MSSRALTGLVFAIAALVSGRLFAAPIGATVPGSSSGVWTQAHGVTVIGGGNQLSDGGSPVSMLTFNGSYFSTSNNPVSIGTFIAQNNANYGAENATATLSLSLNFGNSKNGSHTLFIPVSYHATLNVGTAAQQADTWTLLSLPELTFEEGGYQYLVQVLGFGGINKNGFGDPTHFSIYECLTAEAQLMAKVTAVPLALSEQPEPASLAVWSLLVAGGIGLYRNRRLGCKA